MKKNLLFSMAALCYAIVSTSCSSNSAKITVPEDDVKYLTEVYGGDEFLEIVPGVYNVEQKKGSLSTTIPLKIVKGKRNPKYIVEEFCLYITDSNDKYIKVNDKKVEFLAVEKDAAYNKICKASMGDVVNVTFKYTSTDSKKLKEIAALISCCEIELSIEEPDEDEEEAKAKENAKATVHKSSSDWNKVLDSYESYVNQYIAVLKKVNAGDMSAYGDMASLMEKYEELASQLEDAVDELSPAQAARYTKITNKLASAAL